MARTVLAVVALFSLIVSSPPVQAESEALPAYIDTPTPVPDLPTDKQIQKAVMRCLTSVDSSIAASRRNPRNLGKAEEGEERYCFEQKRECEASPGGFSCRSFIRDYVGE